jgi:hypothetical protein
VLNRAIDVDWNIHWAIALFVHNDLIQVWWNVLEGKLSFTIAIGFSSLGTTSLELHEYPRGRRTEACHPQLADNRDRIASLLRLKEGAQKRTKKQI